MKRIFSLLLAFCILTLSISACSTNTNSGTDVSDNSAAASVSTPGGATASTDADSESNEEPITLNFYSYSLVAEPAKSTMEAIINGFNETVGAEKNIVVQGVPDDTFTVFRADIAAGKNVDVVQHVFGILDASQAELGFNAYEDIFPADEYAEHIQGISENALTLGQIDGKTYGLAFTFSTPMLYINKTIFEEAGLDPESPPTTWEEVLACSEQIYDVTGKNGFMLTPDNGWITDGIFYSNGADILNGDRSEAVFAGAEGIEAIEVWKQIYQSDSSPKVTVNESYELFASGSVGMFLTTTALLGLYKSSAEAGGWELGGAAMPAFEGNTAVPVNSGSCLAVRVDPDDTERAAAIWEFIKYATSAESYTLITSQIGYLPLRTDIADDPAYLKDFVDANPLMKINLEQLQNIRSVTIWPAETAMQTSELFTNTIVRAITTDEDVAAVLSEGQEEINSLLQQ